MNTKSRVTLLYAVFLYNIYLVVCTTGSWTQLRQFGNRVPGCLMGSSLSVIDDETILLFGGLTYTIGAETGPFIYNLDTETWYTPLPEKLPPGRYDHSAIIRKGNLVIYGGRFDMRSAHKIYNDTWQYNIGSEIWQKLDDGGPTMHGHTTVYDSELDTAITFGGCLGQDIFYNDVFTYNFVTNKWMRAQISDVKPEPRCDHSAIQLNNGMIILGGYGYKKTYYDDMWILHYDDNLNFHFERVQLGITGPTARAGHSALLVGTLMWIYGGLDQSTALRDFWEFDTNFSIWSKVSTVNVEPGNRTQHACGKTVAGNMLVFGGYSNEQFLCDLWVFERS